MAVTVQNVIDDVRAVTDQDNSKTPTDAQLIIWIDQANQELRALLGRVRPREFVKVSSTYALTSGNTMTISGNLNVSDYLSFYGLDYLLDGNSTYVRVRPFNFANRNSVWERCYQLEGNTLRILPTDLALGTYRLWYIAAHAAVTAAIDTITLPVGGQNCLVQAVAIKVRVRLGQDPAPHIAALKMFRADLVAQLRLREIAEPSTIVDVQYENDPLPSIY